MSPPLFELLWTAWLAYLADAAMYDSTFDPASKGARDFAWWLTGSGLVDSRTELRDDFAKAALATAGARSHIAEAERAYGIADAMLAERAK